MVYMYYVYLKKDLEANPRSPKVSRTFKDELSAQSYARKLSDAYDVIMLKVDTTQFNMDYSVNSGATYYGRGILDIVFYPHKAHMTSKPTHIRYNHPRNIFSTIYHNFGLLARVCMLAFIAYSFIDAVQANTITVSLPNNAGTTAATNYDVGSGAKHIANNMYNIGMILYHGTADYLANLGIKI